MAKSSKGKQAGSPQPWDLPFATLGALYFLDGGHYLWRELDGKSFKSKFVTAADVIAAFTQQEQESGWMPAGVVRCGRSVKGEWFVYSAPAQKRKVILETDEASIKIPLPRTVLLGIGQEYYLWAVDGAHFDPKMGTFHAPFPNVYSDGKICWGENKPGEAKAGRAREVWEMFFSTPFNAHLANGKSRTERTDVRQALRKLEGKLIYPTGDLNDCGKTIGEAVDDALCSNSRSR